jgi:ABC-2 type transport system permease protein
MIREFYWALRRELWENRWLWLAPSGVAVALAVGVATYAFRIDAPMRAIAALAALHQRQAISQPYDVVAALMMGIGLIVAAIYCVDALYGERRDRSILLWKSLPVSDSMTVLAKLSIPALVLPVIIWALTITVQVVLFLLSAAVLAAHGESTALLWTQLHLGRDAVELLYHLVALHGISTAPFYAWLLLVSAWATRAPFAWAILPPAAIMVFERVAFGTTRIAQLLLDQLGGGTSAPPPAPGATLMESMNAVPLTQLLVAPGLWVGFAVAAVFVAGAVRLRRSAQPV